ncbi:hypothetical protein HZS55_06645 [Halosimplex rubrum]|uniref:MOSC domain-containing protein n=1 Tax=Halosimplex rubrum TaxID=869889 RepID=A0A7D5SX00_9EURY|nr:MOSC domain-containing protein [Halosimplex rubrum]QLH76991.1 hypothetical protein HZS55_06645 [Halosimplex rubrum]
MDGIVERIHVVPTSGGERFRVGEVVCVGTGPCEPCAALADRLDEPGATEALAGRGGLRCRIAESGPTRVGCPIGRS